MPPIEVLLAFTAAAVVMNLSPGPSNFYVMARSIAQGVEGGAVAALGLASGVLLHVLAAVLGLSAVFAHSPMLYSLIKLAGAVYLIYLGIGYWRAPAAIAEVTSPTSGKPLGRIFRESVLVEVTNPKTALFFIALLPQFVVADAGPVAMQLLVLGLIVALSALPCDLLVAVGASRLSRWLASHAGAQRWQSRLCGTMLIAIGGWILAEEARAAPQ
ncbi:MAG: LysE family translocator [Gammaproteobacteria bacterium]|nr:LysE family translocator [Gammaproteobacteria bacterium]